MGTSRSFGEGFFPNVEHVHGINDLPKPERPVDRERVKFHSEPVAMVVARRRVGVAGGVAAGWIVLLRAQMSRRGFRANKKPGEACRAGKID
jgi:hypothetical protein